MKHLIAILLFTGAVYSQCNEDNWQEYYNSKGRDMNYCSLRGAHLTDADLTGVRSGRISGEPSSLPVGFSATGTPYGWKLINGYLIGEGQILKVQTLQMQALPGLGQVV